MVKLFNYIKRYLFKETKNIIFYLLLSFIIWLSNLIIPLLVGRFIDGILVTKSYGYIYNFTIITLMMTLISVICGYILNLIKTNITLKISKNIKLNVSNHIWHSNESKLNSINRAYLSQRVVNDSDSIVIYTINNISEMIINLLTFIFIQIVVIKMNFNIGLFLILTIPIYSLIYIKFKKDIF